ncbi:MAG: hypothetical protein AAF752_00135 [Bacteroidota bacterium]
MATPPSTFSAAIRDVLWRTFRRRRRRRPDPQRGMAIALSLALASIIWFLFSMRETYAVVRTLPTEVERVPATLSLESTPPDAVRVVAEGVGWDLLPLYLRPQAVALDASSNGPIDVFNEVAQSWPSLRISEVSPGEVELQLGNQSRKRVPILLRSNVSVEAPFDFSSPFRLSPDSVLVIGAESLLEELEYWPTERFERDNVRQSFNATLNLVSDSLSNLVILSPPRTTLLVDVAEFTEDEREVPVRVTDIPSGAEPVQLMPQEVVVRYRVSLTDFDRARQADDVYAYVPYDEIRADQSGWVTPRLNVPDGLSVQEVWTAPRRLRYFVILD